MRCEVRGQEGAAATTAAAATVTATVTATATATEPYEGGEGLGRGAGGTGWRGLNCTASQNVVFRSTSVRVRSRAPV